MAVSAGRCAYMNCRLSRRDYPSVHFYKFPVKYPEKCQKWITNSGNTNLLNMPTEKLGHKLLCEMHFEEEAFINRTRHRLVHDATPIPCHLIPPTISDASVSRTVHAVTTEVFTPTLDISTRPNGVLNSSPSTSKNVDDFRVNDDDTNLTVKIPVPKQYRGKRKPESDHCSSDDSDVSKKICLDTMTKDWGRQSIISLIDLYKENSVLYDYKHPAYHNKNSRREALDSISRELSLGLRPGTIPDDVKAKLANLRTQFTAEQHKIATYEKHDHQDSETYKPTLWWYDRMMFLKDYIVPRKLSINESLSSSSSNVRVKEEIFEIGENDIKCELLPSNTREEMDESNESRTPQYRIEKNTEQIFGDFVSNSVVQITDLQTRNKLKVQIMRAISDAQTEDDQNFGNYVTSSLLKIQSTNIKANAKSQITQILCDAQMEDIRN
ncbi:uncharacterized protein CBL_03995 [Carabus blaptoides fortunei]